MFAKLFPAVALAAIVGAAGADAQTRSGPIIPAEVPPASYTAAQYVDSRGCVFIRAGYNGRVTWVPRYGDDRRPMCGYEPSLVAGTTPVTAPVAVAATPATTPRPARTEPVRTQSAGGTPWSVPPEPSRPRVRATAPVQLASGPQGLDTRWSFYDRTGPSPCTNMSPHSQMYMVPSPAMPDLPLRCSPQAQHPADAVRELAPRGGVWEPWDGVNPSPMAPNVYQLPPAYAPRWPDAHLRPAHPPRASAPQVRVSSSGAAAPATTVAPAGRYVQVGTFGVEANARATIARLQSQGLPVATGRVQRGAQQLQVVMAGPFASPAEASAALNSARSLGFGDAFVR